MLILIVASKQNLVVHRILHRRDIYTNILVVYLQVFPKRRLCPKNSFAQKWTPMKELKPCVPVYLVGRFPYRLKRGFFFCRLSNIHYRSIKEYFLINKQRYIVKLQHNWRLPRYASTVQIFYWSTFNKPKECTNKTTQT